VWVYVDPRTRWIGHKDQILWGRDSDCHSVIQNRSDTLSRSSVIALCILPSPCASARFTQGCNRAAHPVAPGCASSRFPGCPSWLQVTFGSKAQCNGNGNGDGNVPALAAEHSAQTADRRLAENRRGRSRTGSRQTQTRVRGSHCSAVAAMHKLGKCGNLAFEVLLFRGSFGVLLQKLRSWNTLMSCATVNEHDFGG